MSPAATGLYAGRTMNNALRSLWDEPRVPHPPPRGWLDWAFVGVLVPLAIGEALFRPDLQLRPLALLLGAVPLLLLLWRRSDPLAVVVVGYTVHVVVHFVPFFGHDHTASLYSYAFVILLPYSLLRWGSGREAVIGLAVILGSHVVVLPRSSATLADALAGVLVLLFPAALGASMRYRTVSRVREIDQVKLREREQLARELHDTVAHHVSAIAISAQAGRAVAAGDPAAAVRTLEVIEAEASRALAEMRAMVGVLRQGDEPALAPQLGVADIAHLADRTDRAGDAPVVAVAPSGDLDDLAPSLDAALYRLAQESITNALRHARRATRIDVAVTGEPDCVRLTVRDDGDASLAGAGPAGYGIVGMTERATLLGGTLQAGPNRGGGWIVTAVLPRTGAAT